MSPKKVAPVIVSLLLLACQRSPDSTIVGEWTQPKPGVPNRVSYRADHTYFGELHDPQHGTFTGAGTWRIEGRQMICRDGQHGESTAEIISIARNQLQIKGPDGIVSTYVRTQ